MAQYFSVNCDRRSAVARRRLPGGLDRRVEDSTHDPHNQRCSTEK